MKDKLQRGMVRAYLAYKRAISNMKGSPTMEYIVVIGVGALFATILYNIFDKDSGGQIMKALKGKVTEYIDGAGKKGGGGT